MMHASGLVGFFSCNMYVELMPYLSFYVSFVKLPDPESEYFAEAVERFRSLCEGRKLVANTDFRDSGSNLLHLRLIDSSDPASAEDPLACANVDLIREGYALIDKKGCKYLKAYPQVLQKLQAALRDAKRERLGMFEFGDIEEDDEEI